MELKDFKKKFAGLFVETDPEYINAETVYSELEEWDSVMVLSLITMLDEENGAVVDVDELIESRTVEDLFNYVKSLCD